MDNKIIISLNLVKSLHPVYLLNIIMLALNVLALNMYKMVTMLTILNNIYVKLSF